jgi:hypothetical protein
VIAFFKIVPLLTPGAHSATRREQRSAWDLQRCLA